MSALHGLYTSTEIFLWISMTITEDKTMRSLPKMSVMSVFVQCREEIGIMKQRYQKDRLHFLITFGKRG